MIHLSQFFAKIAKNKKLHQVPRVCLLDVTLFDTWSQDIIQTF